MNPLRIVIPGGSGQIGRILARHFHAHGHAVTTLTRGATAEPWSTTAWDGQMLGPWTRELDGADVVINLAGRSVNCRYNATNRREIMDSRVHTTRLIGEAIAQASRPPALWINASTATIYRHALDRDMDEHTGELGGNEPGAPAGWSFSIQVARSWERALFDAATPRTRRIALRSAVVVSPDPGGPFDLLIRLVRFGLGVASGSGRQYVSWVHDVDFVSAIEFLIDRPGLDGAINVSSPQPVPNREFMRTLRQAWGTSIGLPAASWVLEIGAVVLRTETELILKSRRVVPTRLLEAGFQFQFPAWKDAARDLVARWRLRRRA